MPTTRHLFNPIHTPDEFDALPIGTVIVFESDGYELVATKAPSGFVDGDFVEPAWVDGGCAYWARHHILSGTNLKVWVG